MNLEIVKVWSKRDNSGLLISSRALKKAEITFMEMNIWMEKSSEADRFSHQFLVGELFRHKGKLFHSRTAMKFFHDTFQDFASMV